MPQIAKKGAKAEQTMKPKNIITGFKAAAERWPDKTAITFLRNAKIETVLTYAQLETDIHQLANFLADQGVQSGDRVILLIPKSIIAVTAHFAVQQLGAVTVPLNPGFKENELAYLLNDADPKLIIVTPDKMSLVQKIQPDSKILAVSTQLAYQDLDFFREAPTIPPDIHFDPQDPGLIIYTSGTTGNPKGAVLTQNNLTNDAANIISIWEISDKDVLCHALPLFHIHGLSFALHTTLLSGAHVRMIDQYTPESVLAELSLKPANGGQGIFMAVPTMYAKMLDLPDHDKKDFNHIRLLTSGSAPLLVQDFQRIKQRFGRAPVEREGMSETGMNFSNPLTGNQKPGSIGLPLPGVEVRIVNPETLKNIADGEIGELWLKSASITPGYWRKPVETKEAFENGWFRTGDLGKKDEEGYYYLTDRIKHIIITGGENVSAKEVETVINQIDGVSESAVVGISDTKWGEKVVAAIAPKAASNLTDSDIKAFCRERLHDWKCPKSIVFVDEIPKNTMGKMLKESVKDLFETS